MDKSPGHYNFMPVEPKAAPKVYTLADLQERLTRVRTISGHGELRVIVVNGQIVEIDTLTKERA